MAQPPSDGSEGGAPPEAAFREPELELELLPVPPRAVTPAASVIPSDAVRPPALVCARCRLPVSVDLLFCPSCGGGPEETGAEREQILLVDAGGREPQRRLLARLLARAIPAVRHADWYRASARPVALLAQGSRERVLDLVDQLVGQGLKVTVRPGPDPYGGPPQELVAGFHRLLLSRPQEPRLLAGAVVVLLLGVRLGAGVFFLGLLATVLAFFVERRRYVAAMTVLANDLGAVLTPVDPTLREQARRAAAAVTHEGVRAHLLRLMAEHLAVTRLIVAHEGLGRDAVRRLAPDALELGRLGIALVQRANLATAGVLPGEEASSEVLGSVLARLDATIEGLHQLRQRLLALAEVEAGLLAREVEALAGQLHADVGFAREAVRELGGM